MCKICAKCNSTKFKVNLIGEGVVDMTNGQYELESQGELRIDNSSLTCAACGHVNTEETLREGLVCADCKTVTDVNDMVQLQNDDQSLADPICNACYAKMCTPDPSQMTQEELIASNQSKDAEMDTMRKSMEAMQAQMQQMMAMMNGGNQVVQQPVVAPQVQKQTIQTNLQTPQTQQQVPVNSIAPQEVPTGIFGEEAPF